MSDNFDRFLQISEDGYFKIDELRVADAEMGRRWLSDLQIDDRGRVVLEENSQRMLVEAFDEPFVALQVEKKHQTHWYIQLPYGHEEDFELNSLTLDEWDRFHGRTRRGIPFVMSRNAQAQFFNLVDDYDDETIHADGQTYTTHAWLRPNPEVSSDKFWTTIYQTQEPRWEIEEPAPALVGVLPKLKLPPSRILVLGAGSANDAAYLAQQGHFVTAVDFSAEAIQLAQKKFGQVERLKFLQADMFHLPREMDERFDVVFEHTCYCAVSPERRNELVSVWRRALVEGGHLLGVFFAMDKTFGPPYGGSEWEIRQRLNKKFHVLLWSRWRHSIAKRQGQELMVYAQKITTLK